MVYSFEIVVITSILQKIVISETFFVKFELSFHSKMYYFKHSAVLSLFQKKLCYKYNCLGELLFDYIAGVTRDGKFAGYMVSQSIQIVFVDD